MLSPLGSQFQKRVRYTLHCNWAPGQRNCLSAKPEAKQVIVVERERVPRLPSGENNPCCVPGTKFHDEAQRGDKLDRA